MSSFVKYNLGYMESSDGLKPQSTLVYSNSVRYKCHDKNDEDVRVCRACLSSANLRSLSKLIANIFSELTTSTNPYCDALPQYLCSICLAFLKKLFNFRIRCNRSKEILVYLKNNGQLSDKSINDVERTKCSYKLTLTAIENSSYKPDLNPVYSKNVGIDVHQTRQNMDHDYCRYVDILPNKPDKIVSYRPHQMDNIVTSGPNEYGMNVTTRPNETDMNVTPRPNKPDKLFSYRPHQTDNIVTSGPNEYDMTVTSRPVKPIMIVRSKPNNPNMVVTSVPKHHDTVLISKPNKPNIIITSKDDKVVIARQSTDGIPSRQNKPKFTISPHEQSNYKLGSTRQCNEQHYTDGDFPICYGKFLDQTDLDESLTQSKTLNKDQLYQFVSNLKPPDIGIYSHEMGKKKYMKTRRQLAYSRKRNREWKQRLIDTEKQRKLRQQEMDVKRYIDKRMKLQHSSDSETLTASSDEHDEKASSNSKVPNKSSKIDVDQSDRLYANITVFKSQQLNEKPIQIELNGNEKYSDDFKKEDKKILSYESCKDSTAFGLEILDETDSNKDLEDDSKPDVDTILLNYLNKQNCENNNVKSDIQTEPNVEDMKPNIEDLKPDIEEVKEIPDKIDLNKDNIDSILLDYLNKQ